MLSKTATREAYGSALVRLGESHEEIVTVDADLSAATKTTAFSRKFPTRSFNVGIAEQNMIGFAAGLAMSGFLPFASTFAVFAPGRVYDQIRQCIAYPRIKVRIVGTHGGVTVGEDGGTHQALEDIALMRALPNMTVVVPCDAVETEKAVAAVLDYPGPVYLRLGREALPEIVNPELPFEIGKSSFLREGKDLYFVATGIMVGSALEAARELEREGISAGVVNVSTIKPMDETAIERAAATGKIVVAEEHSVIGGLGSAVSELLFRRRLNRHVDLRFVGVEDRFGQTGHPNELLEEYGLTAAHLAREAVAIVGR